MTTLVNGIEPKRNTVRPKKERIIPAGKRRRGRIRISKPFINRATIVDRKSGKVYLKEIVSSGPFLFKPEDMDHVWCIPIGLSHGGLTFERAVERVSAFASLNYQHGRNHLPALIVLADMRELSPRNRRRISSELEAAGAVFVDWPKGSSSVDEAFQRVASQMRANY